MWTAWITGIAHAAGGPGDAVALGLFVGSNRAGPGQEELHYALDDAERFRDVLEELGDLGERGTLLEDPDADELREALSSQAARLRDYQQAGASTVFVFYYSGHARSQTLTLGDTEFPLAELRSQLQTMPSTVTVAVLDACQSGSISGVKGVEPAAAFSWNSTDLLRAEGLAVMASSTGSELSQESEAIGGSFFTHHLVSGLRGPADEDGDDVVSLDEAYRHAYRETLLATTLTQVGSQHPTLETQLRGHGEMTLTRPRTAGRAHLVFDGPTGRVLATRANNGAIVAEVQQNAEAPLTVALGPGAYRLVGAGAAGAYRCEARLVDGARVAVSELSCTEQKSRGPNRAKGPPARRAYRPERLGLELALGSLLSSSGGAWLDRLDTFGFARREPGRVDAPITPTLGTSVAVRLGGRTSLAAAWSLLERDARVRDWNLDAGSDTLRWSASRLGVYPRYTAPLRGDTLLLVVQGGPGLTIGTESTQTAAGSTRTRSTGPHVAGSLALHLVDRRSRVTLGPFLQIDGVWSPALPNALGDRRNVGGLGLSLGLRVAP